MAAGLARFVWPGMILAGVALAAAVWASWPASETRLVRLPYGESQPKAPAVAAPKPAVRPAPAESVSVFPSTVEASPAPSDFDEGGTAEEPGRALAGVDRSASTEDVDQSDGPAPVPSDFELSGDYAQESPEDLGAEPLPGADLTQAPPAAG